MNLIEKIKEKAKQNLKSLVLSEAHDERILKAAGIIMAEGFASKVILTGDEKNITESMTKLGISLKGIEIVNPAKSDKLDTFAQVYYDLRKVKEPDLTIESAKTIIMDPEYFGALMVKEGLADALIAGADNTTAKIVRVSLQIIDRISKDGVVSSCFIMVVPDCDYGENGIIAFADSAVVPNPNARQLAGIAANTAQTFNVLTGCAPKVAMLSFSTKGSAKHRMVDKIVEATKLAKENNPDILIDGELQPDAALVPFIAEKKAKDSPVAGSANVLIFPNLDSGNIAYKLVERLAKAKAYGPLIQGLKKPISDLSRGCSVNDIVDISAITLVRALK